jgi:hypothetical protein
MERFFGKPLLYEEAVLNRLLLCGIVAATLCAGAFGQTVVVPNANTSVVENGNGGNISTAASFEFQDIYAASQFPGPINITGFAFRGVPGSPALSVIGNGTVQLSTSTNTPSSSPGPLLSNTFASNVGANVTTVYGGAFAMSGAACSVSGTTPCAFASPVVFTTPFYYNPQAGSLLFDAKLSSVVTNLADAVNCSAPGCTEAGIYTTPYPGSATGNGIQYGGNVTEFTYTAVPNTSPVPPSILLTIAGLAMVGFYVGMRGVKFA